MIIIDLYRTVFQIRSIAAQPVISEVLIEVNFIVVIVSNQAVANVHVVVCAPLAVRDCAKVLGIFGAGHPGKLIVFQAVFEDEVAASLEPKQQLLAIRPIDNISTGVFKPCEGEFADAGVSYIC